MWLCITPERRIKTERLMRALAAGGTGQIVAGPPPDDGQPFVVWGQAWLTLRIVPPAYRSGRPFWVIDNGFWNPAKGLPSGNYRFTYRGMSPILLQDQHIWQRPHTIRCLPWRKSGSHILIALPGPMFGTAIGLNMKEWIREIENEIRRRTNRAIVVREKGSSVALVDHLKHCHALVTHSSNVAIDAAIAGVPVFVAPTSPAAPVGCCNLDLEHPVTPDRKHWLQSLNAQQFTIDEMRLGIAFKWMQRVAEQVDGKPAEEKQAWQGVSVTAPAASLAPVRVSRR